MHPAIFHSLRAFIADYGYWAVAGMLFCENAGIPVPGETTLLLASFLAYSEHQLHFGWIVAVATCAATLGDNLGYALGYYGGRPVLDRYRAALRIAPATIERGELMFARYGAATIFFARFVFGMRVFAGPLAGVLRMRWRAFAVYNFLGASVWVAVVAGAGYLFGHHWRSLLRVARSFNIAVVIITAIAILYSWWRYRRQSSRNHGSLRS
ncbi:MAG: DedA family protein [Terriglobales bacterium]|jgi:membrane-associated protein